MMRFACPFLFIATLLLAVSASAESKSNPAEAPWVAFSGSFGFSGEIGFGLGADGAETSSASRANPTAGFVINGGVPLLDHLKVGGQLGFHWLQSESMDRSNTDRHFAFDFQLLLRPYLTFLNGRLELFADIIQGLTVIDHQEQRFSTISGLVIQPEFGNGIAVVPNTFVGWSGQVLVGLEYHFMTMLSAHMKIGYAGWYAVAKDASNDSIQASVQAHQFALVFGASYTF